MKIAQIFARAVAETVGYPASNARALAAAWADYIPRRRTGQGPDIFAGLRCEIGEEPWCAVGHRLYHESSYTARGADQLLYTLIDTLHDFDIVQLDEGLLAVRLWRSFRGVRTIQKAQTVVCTALAHDAERILCES